MIVLDLFAGLGGWSQAFKDRGHEVITIDNDLRFDVSLYADIGRNLDLEGMPHPDIILASPPCTAFSVMQIGRNWNKDNTPKTDKAVEAIRLVEETRRIISTLNPTYYIIENPIGKLRKLDVVADLPRISVNYCQYGEDSMKATDLWGVFPPTFIPRERCKNGMSCHIAAPRGSKTGTQKTKVRRALRIGLLEADYEFALTAQRSKVPYDLSLDICLAAEASLWLQS